MARAIHLLQQVYCPYDGVVFVPGQAGRRDGDWVPVAYIHRDAERRLQELATWLRVVIVNGPRQSGKTTLLRMFRNAPAPPT